MGIFSNSSNDTGALEEFYSRAIGKFVAAKTGGNSYALQKNDVSSIAAFGGSVSGGYSALEEYGNSVYSSAKEKLIRGIAKDVSSMLKVTANYADTADIQDVVAKLQRIVPDPKNNKSIKADSGMHKDLCMALAKSINKQYDMNIIDADAEPSIICNKVSEIMYSLFTGLHSEFLTISGDVSRILSNLQVLQEYVDSANKKLIQNLEKTNDGDDSETESIKALYAKLSEEIDRQHAILANLTNSVIGPVGESLITILEDNDDFAQLTTDLKKMTGATEFGNKLSYLLSGTSGIASAAAIVDKALKKIGMTVAEYKSVHGLRELREKVYNSMVKQKPGSGELQKLLVAAELLYKNDMAHDDIVAYLEKKKGGMRGGAKTNTEFGDSFADAADIDTYTSNVENPFAGRPQAAKRSVIKQISDKQQLRKQLFLTLNQKIKADYDKIKLSLAHISRKIGGEIELCPELDVFVRQLNNFADSQPDKQNIHIALSGYRTDIESTFVKYQFMENLYAISESANDLLACKGGQAFKEIKDAVDTLTHNVEEFNATFLNTLTDVSVRSLGVGSKTIKHASGGVQIDKFAEMLNGGHNGVDHSKHQGGHKGSESDCGCEGGDDHAQQEDPEEQEDADFEGNTKDAESQIFHKLGGVVGSISASEFNHFRTMKRSIREIDYYYRIADIKRNMQVTAGEYENNTENYENILGEEAGYTIDAIQKKYNDLINALESDTAPQGVTMDIGKLYAGDRTLPAVVPLFGLDKRLYEELKVQKTAGTPAQKLELEDYESGYKFLLEYIRSSKTEMLEAAQALDLYLSKFTQSIQFKPDQIKEFVQVLEQLEIVAKWFTDKSGDHLAGVFEAFSSAPAPANFPNNAIANLAAIGTTSNALDDTVKNQLDDKYTLSNHYYTEVSAAGVAKAPNTAGKFYQPRMMTRTQAVNFVKQIEKSVKSVRALENIIATFSRVNTSVSADVKTFMSSGLMFKAFMKYCTASVISIGYLSFDQNKNIFNASGNIFIGDAFKSIHTKMAVGLRFNNDAIKLETGPTTIYLELCDPLSIYTTKTENSLVRNNDVCDNIYEMSIKSMIAKVFTIVGSYTLFNKPAKDQMNSFSMATNPLRQILGGSVGGVAHASIIPAATELYVRLPLLVEWYREVFDFNRDAAIIATTPNPIISMIPDMDSVFGPLCKVIFLDAVNVVDGAYPAEYAHRIIDAITNIYKFHTVKKPYITTREILNEFVLEINRRYGFVMRQEVNAYLDERSAYINADESYPDDNRVDYDLLDVDAGMGKRPAPSDKFRAFSKTKSARKFDAMDLLKSAKRFRQSIEKNLQLDRNSFGLPVGAPPVNQFEDSDFSTIANISLSGIVAQTKRKIEELPTDDDKYMVVHEQLHGIEKFGDLDQQKIILFHETVVTPLTVLYFTYLVLNDYNKFCVSLNPGDENTTLTYFTAPELLVKNIGAFKGNGNYKSNNINNVAIVAGVAPIFYLGPQGGPIYNETDYDTLLTPSGYAGYVRPVGAVANTRQTLFEDITLETLLRKLMNVGSDMNGLTEVYFVGSDSSNTYPALNYDKLEEMCTELLNNAKSAMHQLRKFVPASLVKKYENITDDTANVITENRISLFYLQEQLFERLFKNKYGNGLTDANIGLKNIYLTMTKDYPLALAPLPTSRSFSKVFSKLAYWDASLDLQPYGVDIKGINTINIAPADDNIDLQEVKLNNSSNLGFPLAYNPLFNSGASFANLTREDSKVIFSATALVPLIEAAKISKIINDAVVLCRYNILPFIGPLVEGNERAPIIPGSRIFVGAKNLYDMNDNDYNTRNATLGLIPKLNTIINKFCNIFIDKSSGKIYKTLIEKFVNGHNAKDILNGKNINDNICTTVGIDNTEGPIIFINTTIVKSVVCKTEPKPNAILFASVANGLRGLALGKSEKLTGSSLAFVEDNFLNISEYQKELMRANLPAFEKELNLIVKRADFMKKCLEETHVQTTITEADITTLNAAVDVRGIPIRIPDENQLLGDIDSVSTQKNKRFAAEINASRKSYLIGIYDDIALTAKSLIRCIVDTQKELNDVPMYFETYNESLIDYNSRNGHLPFMPVSNITHLLNFNSFTAINEGVDPLLPVKFNLSVIPRISMGAGSPEFKFTYGTRGLLHYKQTPSLQYAPGVQELLESYNAKLGGAASFDKTKLEHITKGVINISRWCIDYMYHNQVLDKCNWNDMRNLVLKNQLCIPVDLRTPNIKDGKVQNLTCQTAKSIVVGGVADYSFWGNTANIILLSESDNYGESVYRFMKGLNDDAANKLSGAQRKDYRIFNILDLNIVPINIHAMQREIPFVNLFNYAYTFDHMVKNFIGVGTKTLALTSVGGEIPVNPAIPGLAGLRPGLLENEDAYIIEQFNDDINKPEDTLVRQLIYPLGLRRVQEYVTNTYRLMSGSTSLGLNRPKYLSDQLWNKVLLNAVYDNQAELTDRPKYALIPPLGVPAGIPGLVDNDEPFVVGYITAATPVSNSLSYIDKYNVLQMLPAAGRDIGYQGFIRYQSKLIRWTEWFVQLQRIVRLLMRSQLDWIQDPVVQGSDAISADVTEYKKNNVFSVGDYE